MANPFAIPDRQFERFPSDEFVDVTLISYQQADLPPGPLADTNDVVPCVRFLFAGYARNEDGSNKLDPNGLPIIIRKWTDWMRISNNKKAKIMQVFNGFDNLFDVLQDCDSTDSKLWATPYKLLLEDSDKYQKVLKIKPGTNRTVVDEVFYDDKYIPYKVVKAYGKPQMLTLAACKFKSGVRTFQPDEMAEPGSGDN